eukprot:scaffold86973_cov50-Phaeocystis_antarctica.AAC.1
MHARRQPPHRCQHHNTLHATGGIEVVVDAVGVVRRVHCIEVIKVLSSRPQPPALCSLARQVCTLLEDGLHDFGWPALRQQRPGQVHQLADRLHLRWRKGCHHLLIEQVLELLHLVLSCVIFRRAGFLGRGVQPVAARPKSLALIAVEAADGGEQLGQRQPLLRVGVQQLFLAREPAHPLRIGGELERLLVVSAVGDGEGEDGDVAAVEGPLQREQLEEQHAQRPHVGGLAVGLRRERLGDAEVAQFDRAIGQRAIGQRALGEEDVGRLESAVQGGAQGASL